MKDAIEGFAIRSSPFVIRRRGRKDSTGQVEKDVACRGGQEAS